MQKILGIFDWKNYIFTVIALISFSNFMVVLFGQTIPGIFSTFFKYAGETIILLAVLLFALTWFVKAKPHHKIKKYYVVVFDIFGKKSEITDIRTEFKTHDVAWSFMKQYKEAYPHYNFALISDLPKSEKPTIFRYI